ncbi:MAG TPA: polyhydroxyalkanoate synthesis regulator DNA-binding domain-containing protein [Thermoanaerobaculia bacterium]
MIRLIKRYESRKLYDTEESRYVSLEEIASWVRQGQEVRVVDNATGADVTSQTLTQIILDEGRKGTSFLPSELLHDLVRLGERAMQNGLEQVSTGVDRLVQASIDRLAPVRRVREEMTSLRSRLEQLEASLADLEREGAATGSPEPVIVGADGISRPLGREEK